MAQFAFGGVEFGDLFWLVRFVADAAFGDVDDDDLDVFGAATVATVEDIGEVLGLLPALETSVLLLLVLTSAMDCSTFVPIYEFMKFMYWCNFNAAMSELR